MRIGIDFGTTRVVVASVDRGNFPLVNFETPDGQACDWFPPIVAVRGSSRLYGWQAVAALDDDSWTVLRSLKRDSAQRWPPNRASRRRTKPAPRLSCSPK